MQSVKHDNTLDLRIWEKIRIVAGDGPEAGYYEARVEDVINGGVMVTNPELVGGKTLLRHGMMVRVQMTRTDAAYEFESRIRVQVLNGTRRVILSPPRRTQRVQRRLFVRVELSVHVRYALVDDDTDWTDFMTRLHWNHSYTRDISGGGILLRLVEPIESGALLAMDIEMFEKIHSSRLILGKCYRTIREEGETYAGVKFLLAEGLRENVKGKALDFIPPAFRQFGRKDQDKLVTFLFNEQIELRRKGLI